MKELMLTVSALVLSFLFAVWTGDGTAFMLVLMFSVLALVGTVIENRHNGT